MTGRYTGGMAAPVTPLVHELIPCPDPWQVARTLAHLPHLLFLDSADRHPQRGRYSYVTAAPRGVFRVDAAGVPGRPTRDGPDPPDDDFFHLLASAAEGSYWSAVPDLPPFQGGFAGLYGYGLGRRLERLPAPRADEFGLAHAAIGRYEWVVSFDHAQGRAWLVGSPPPTVGHANACPTAHPLTGFPGVTSNFSRDGYEAAVRRAVEYVHAGDVFQVNLSQRLLAPLTEHPLDLYGRLRERNPAPFGCYFDAGDFQIVSASPERFVQVAPDGWMSTTPIKGTRPRGKTPAEDATQLHALTTSEKDRAENVMIVDLLRNDLGRVCDFGSVSVPRVCEVETYRFVHHLVSEVRGKLRSGADAVRPAAGGVPRRQRHGRPEGAGHGDHRRTRTDGPRAVLW